MTGIERLRELADMRVVDNGNSKTLHAELRSIATQIEREHAEDCYRMVIDHGTVSRVASEMERHVLGVEGMEDSPVSRWERELRAALGGMERDHAEDVSMSAYDLLPQEDREAIAWVREHGGIAKVKEERNHSRNLKRSLETARAKVERQQRHIEFVQRKCRERQEHICELNKLKRAYIDALNGVCKRLGLTDGTGLPDMPEVIWTELRRRLVPDGMEWPRFEDGEPVRFGDVVSDGDETGRVYYVTFDTVNPVIIGFTDETPDQDPGTWLEVSVSDGERVKRPAPKVLDADGVEIREGDTVWLTDHYGPRSSVPRAPWSVSRIVYADHLRVICDDAKNGHLNTYPESLTYRAPVLAADGKPLREGEHVYHVETGAELVVKELPKPGEYQAVVVFAPPASHLTSFDPDQLTHERPDSWERLEEDATIYPRDYCSEHGLYIDPYDCDAAPATEKFARDLVRRAKKLAERGA